MSGNNNPGAVSPERALVNQEIGDLYAQDAHRAQVQQTQSQEIQRINQEIKADPALADKVRVVDLAGSDPARDIKQAASDLHVDNPLPGISDFKGGDTTTFAYGGNKAITVILPEQNAVENAGIDSDIPLTAEFKRRLEAADGGKIAPLHETGHAIARAGGVNESEKVADATMGLARIAEKESGMADKLKTIAEARDIYFLTHSIDPEHNTADVLLRERAALLADPDGMDKALAGAKLRDIGNEAQVYAKASDAALKDTVPWDQFISGLVTSAADRTVGAAAADTNRAAAYAWKLVQSDLSHTPPPPQVEIPGQLGMNGALTLMRMGKSVEDAFGNKDNAITRALPEIEEQNRKAFAQAREYAKNAGMQDMIASAAPPATPAAQKQGLPGQGK